MRISRNDGLNLAKEWSVPYGTYIVK